MVGNRAREARVFAAGLLRPLRDVQLVGVAVFRQPRAERGAAVLAQDEQARRKGRLPYPLLALRAWGAPLMRPAARPPQVVKHTRNVSLGSITWKKFPDGFPNIFVHDVESIKGCHVVFLASFSQVAASVPERPCSDASCARVRVCACVQSCARNTHANTCVCVCVCVCCVRAYAQHTHTNLPLPTCSGPGAAADPALTCWFLRRPAKFLSR